MYPDNFEIFELILDSSLDLVEGDMNNLITKLDSINENIGKNIIKYMFGRMEIHDDVMDIYDTEGNLVRKFALFDIAGNPTTSSPVYKREIEI